MNQGQEKFFYFIMERVDKENREKAKNLLEESFKRQGEWTFNKD